MPIDTARFIISLPEYGSFPGIGLPQIAVVGRSNVGKSTLINSLCRIKGLAKTSGTPGKTRLINVFLINDAYHLIDLPGYGYAKVGKAEIHRWADMTSGYFEGADTLRAVIHLVDIRHEPTRDDVTMNTYLRQRGIPFITVATKADKVSRAARQRSLMPIYRTLAVQPWELVAYSSQTGEGRDQLLSVIDGFLA